MPQATWATWPPSRRRTRRCDVDLRAETHAADVIAGALTSAAADGPCLLGVDGRSGSGKTHLAGDIAEVLRHCQASVVVVSMDDLYPGWQGLAASLPTLCQDVIIPLSHGQPGAYRRYDWSRGAFAETVHVPVADAVIIEGVGSTTHWCRPLLRATVWVHAPRDVRLGRACGRTGQGDFAAYADRWSEQEDWLFGPDAYPLTPAAFDFVVATESVLVDG